MDKKINLSLNLPSDWYAQIESIAQEKELSLSELITNIIGQYLGNNLEDVRLDRLEKQYKDLNKRTAILENQDYQIAILQNRLEIMEKLIASLQTQVISRPVDRLSHSLMLNEEIEDEPDEILTDFLD